MTHGKFFDEAYFWLLKVPRGKVTTYGEIARAMGGKAYRVVGLAMKNNKNSPNPIANSSSNLFFVVGGDL